MPTRKKWALLSFAKEVRVQRLQFLLTIPLLALGCALAGCNQPAPTPAGGDTSAPANTASANTVSSAAPSTNAPTGKLKVALLTPGDINDQGWNQLAYEGLQAVQHDLGAEVAHQVTKNAADQEPALRDFGDKKFDLVICHGFEYGKRVLGIAPEYPDTKFVVVGGNVKQAPNVATIVPRLEEATYLLGMAAGGMTKSNVIGAIGGMKLPVITSTFDAYRDGAHAVNPQINVLTNYIGNFEDQNAAKEASKTMIAGKADFIFHNADQAGKGMFNAAEEASNVFVFGSNRNQNSVAPTVCLASAVIEMPRAFVELARSVQNHKFAPEFIELNMPRGTVSVVRNPALKAKVPAALMQKIAGAEQNIKSGKLKIQRHV